MERFRKLLAAATLLVLPIIAACGEDVVPPPATGSIAGQVSIEGMGIDGVSVNLSNGASTTTAGGGTYRFDGVEAGAYTVTISGFPADASFDATSAAATIPENGGSVTLDFRGSYIRTASIIGTVTVGGTASGPDGSRFQNVPLATNPLKALASMHLRAFGLAPARWRFPGSTRTSPSPPPPDRRQ